MASSSSSYRSWADRIVDVPPIETKETEIESASSCSAAASSSSSTSPQSLAATADGATTSFTRSSFATAEDAANEDIVFLAPVDDAQPLTSSSSSEGNDVSAIAAFGQLSSSSSHDAGEEESPPEIIDLTALSDVVSSEQLMGEASVGLAQTQPCATPSGSSESSPEHPIVVEDNSGDEEEEEDDEAGTVRNASSAGHATGAGPPPETENATTTGQQFTEPALGIPSSPLISESGAAMDGEEVARAMTSTAGEHFPPQDDSLLVVKDSHNDVTATTSMDVTGMTVTDEDDDDDDVDDDDNDSKDELKYSDTSVRTDEHEIAFGDSSAPYGANVVEDDDDDDELNLDVLLAKTTDDDEDDDIHNDVDSAAEAEEVEQSFDPRRAGTSEEEDGMDDLLNELLDDTHNAAEELDDLLNEQQMQQQQPSSLPLEADDVPHVGDVDEVKVAMEAVPATATSDTAPPSSTAVTPVSVAASKPTALRHVQPLANLGKDGETTASAAHETMPAAKVTRPNLSARIPGTRRYVAPSSKADKKQKKPSLTVEIPEPKDLGKTATSSPSRRRWSPKSDPSSTPPPRMAETGASAVSSSAAAAAPAPEKKSMLKTFTRALSSGPKPKLRKSPPGELSPRAQAVLPTLKPIEPTSRLLKETSASVAQKRHRFIPPPLSFPTIGEVMRAIHSGAFDRKPSAAAAAAPDSDASSSSPRSTRRGGGKASASRSPTHCGGSVASSRSRPRKKSAL